MTQNSPTPGFKFGAAPSEPNALIKRPEVPSHTPVEGFKMAMRTPALGPVMNRTIGSNTAISKVAQANGSDSILPSIKNNVTGDATLVQLNHVGQSERPYHHDVDDRTELQQQARMIRSHIPHLLQSNDYLLEINTTMRGSSEEPPAQVEVSTPGVHKPDHDLTGNTLQVKDGQRVGQPAVMTSSAAKAGNRLSFSTSSTGTPQTCLDQHEVHDTHMLDRDDDMFVTSAETRPSPADASLPQASSGTMSVFVNAAEAKHQTPLDATFVHTATQAAPAIHTTEMTTHADVARHRQSSLIPGKVDHDKVNKPKAKAKSAKLPRAPTSFRSDQLFGLYQHTLHVEQVQELEALKKQVLLHNTTIAELHEDNEALAAEKEHEVGAALAKIKMLADFTKKIDVDMPAIQSQGKTILKELDSLLQVRDECRDDISASQAEIERLGAKYKGIVKSIGDEARAALARSDDLRLRLDKSELQLSEEKFRSLGLEKQLQLATEAKNKMLGKLDELQAQLKTMESLLQMKAGPGSSAMASAVDSILLGVTANATSGELKASLKHLEDTVRQLYESHAQRLEGSSNSLDQQLTNATTSIIAKFDDMPASQKQTGVINSENARLTQQLADKDARLVEHVKTQQDLLSAKTELEARVSRAGEECARLKERLECVPKTLPAQDSPVVNMQVALLGNDNVYLKGEVKELGKRHELVDKARNELLRQVDDLQKRIEQGKEEFRLLQEAQTDAARAAKKTLDDSIKHTKEEVRKSMQAAWGQRSMEYENKLRQGQTEIEKLKTKLHETQDELGDYRAKSSSTQKDTSELQLLREELRIDKEKLAQHEQQLQAQTAALTKSEEERRTLQAQCKLTGEERDGFARTANAQHEELLKLKDTFQASEATAQKELGSLRKDSDLKTTSLQKQMHAERSDLNQRVEQAEAATNTAEEARAKLQSQVDALTKTLVPTFAQINARIASLPHGTPHRKTQTTSSPLLSDPPELTPETMRFGQDAERRKNTSNTATKVTRPTTPVYPAVRFSTDAASTLESRGTRPDTSIYAESQSQDVSQCPSESRSSQASRTPLKSSLKRKSTVDLPAVPAKKTKVTTRSSNTTPINAVTPSTGFASARSSPQPSPSTTTHKSIGALSHVRTSAGLTKSKTGPTKTSSVKLTSTGTVKTSSMKPTSTGTTKSSSTKPGRTASGSQ